MKTTTTKSCLMTDDSVARSTAFKVGSALETSRNLCLFNEKRNEVQGLSQKFESLHIHDLTNSLKQAGILTLFF